MLSLIFDFLGKTSYWTSFGIYISRYIVNICNICILRALFSWICFCKPITLHLENWISPSHWQDIICSSGKISSAQEFASVSLHQEVWIFSIPLAEFHQLKILNRASTVQESTSVNLSFSTGRIGFSTLMAGLHLFKNLLLSAYHSPTKKKWISPPQWQGFI